MKMKTFTINVNVFDGTDAKSLENLLEYAFDEFGIDGVCHVEEVEEEAEKDGVSQVVRPARTLDELENYLNDNGWRVLFNLSEWLLMKSSPAGEDLRFVISAENIDKAIADIKQLAADFDVVQHVENWVEARKNGGYQSTRLGGLPDDKALKEDALAIKRMLVNLAEDVSHFEQKALGETLADAVERSDEHKGFNAYDEIRRLTALKKERPLTQDEEETLFYCKNATAEQDYYDSLE